MRSILEKAIVHLLNDETDKAEALFHKFMVERARQIHESLRQGDDVVLAEGWDDEITSEEYLTDDDFDGLADDGEGQDDGPLSDDQGDEGDEGDEGDAEITDEGDEGDVNGDEGSVDDRLDDVEDQIDRLTREFEAMMADVDDADADADIAADDADDADADAADADADATDADLDADDADDDAGDADADAIDADLDADDADADVDAMDEEDLADEDLADITESVVSELERVTTSNQQDREVGAGKVFKSDDRSPLPQKPISRRNDATPVSSKGPDHTSYDLQTPPPSKDINAKLKARNSKRRAADFTSKVPPKGDASAALNKDYAGGVKPGRSPIA